MTSQSVRAQPSAPATRSAPLLLAIAVAATALIAVAAVSLGPVRIGPGTVWSIVLDHVRGEVRTGAADAIVWEIRVPRVLLAMIVGAALTTAGIVVQALARNALADPYLLGVSSGASVGVTAVLLFGALGGLGTWALSAGSIAGALVATVAVFAVSRTEGQLNPTRLILCGVVLSAMFEAIATFLLFAGNPQATQSVLFRLLGSFGQATWSQLWIPVLVLTGTLGWLLGQARMLNALALGEDEAIGLGIDIRRARRSLFLVAAAVAGVCVAVSGIIGFVGLVVPHLVRLLVGSDHRRVLALGVPLGAGFLVLADLLARTAFAPQELPIGVVTAFVGAPALLILLYRQSRAAAR